MKTWMIYRDNEPFYPIGRLYPISRRHSWRMIKLWLNALNDSPSRDVDGVVFSARICHTPLP
jgi:hypothetical protein